MPVKWKRKGICQLLLSHAYARCVNANQNNIFNVLEQSQPGEKQKEEEEENRIH